MNLAHLRDKSAEAAARAVMPTGDDVSKMNPIRRHVWHRQMSGVIGSERLEEALLRPMAHPGFDAEALSYLKQHGEDEDRHAHELTTYLNATFGSVLVKRSVMTTYLYGRVVPWLGRKLATRPLPLVALVHAYERMSLFLYAELRRIARDDGMFGLDALLASIEKDERRHIAGMQLIMKRIPERTFMDRIQTRAIFGVMALDLRFPRWAVHNNNARQRMDILGINTDGITRAVDEAIDEAYGHAFDVG